MPCKVQVVPIRWGPARYPPIVTSPISPINSTLLPPIPLTWKKTSSGSQAVFPIPANISHPLPGIEGGFVTLTNVSFKKLTKKVQGKTVGYLQSICKKGTTRTFSFTSSDPAPQGTVTTTIKLRLRPRGQAVRRRCPRLRFPPT